MNTKTVTWNNCEIRFVRQYGEWYAVLEDVISALDLEVDLNELVNLSEQEGEDLIIMGESDNRHSLVNELMIYRLAMMSSETDTKNWLLRLMRQFRHIYGFEGYEVFRLLDNDIQSDISAFLNSIYWDEEKGKLMRSVTVPSGDVEQVPVTQI